MEQQCQIVSVHNVKTMTGSTKNSCARINIEEQCQDDHSTIVSGSS